LLLYKETNCCLQEDAISALKEDTTTALKEDKTYALQEEATAVYKNTQKMNLREDTTFVCRII